MMVAALVAGGHGAASALAGGLVSITAGLASALAASMGNTKSAGGIVLSALRAEAVKLGLAVSLLWLVLANYREAVVGALIATFVVTLVIFSMAFFVREY
jgi:ATP synthase protein I